VKDFEVSNEVTGAAAFPDGSGRLRLVAVERNGTAREMGISPQGQLASRPVPVTIPGLNNGTSLAWLDGHLLAADSGQIVVLDRTGDGGWKEAVRLTGFEGEIYLHSDGRRLAVSDTAGDRFGRAVHGMSVWPHIMSCRGPR
jgi:hypothetical protein